jgi:hypothetical protein
MRGPVMQVGVTPERSTLHQVNPPAGSEPLRFVPFYKVNEETYTKYFTQR